MFDVTVVRDPAWGVIARTSPHSPASEQITRLLTQFGFARRTPQEPWALGPTDGSVVLHLRDLVTALRRSGLRVNADPGFEYLASQPLNPDQERALDDAAQAMAAQTRPRLQAAIGSHPDHGTVVRLLDDQPATQTALQHAGFAPVPGTHLHAYTGPADTRVTAARSLLADLRAAGLTVAADFAYEPAHVRDQRLAKVSPRARAARATSPHAHATPTSAPSRPAVAAAPQRAWSRTR